MRRWIFDKYSQKFTSELKTQNEMCSRIWTQLPSMIACEY